MPKITKPPLGLKPRWLHNEERSVDLAKAIMRYIDAGVALPDEWIDEWNDIVSGKINFNEKTMTERMSDGVYD